MMANKRKLKAADLFCGGGGFTTGAEQSGRVSVVLAVNHWRTAIDTHSYNHPRTRHICARIDDIDPRHDKSIPELDILLASPECTHHSIARGGRPIDDQKRATPWHVCVWAEAKRPKWIVVENVREFRNWGPLDDRGQPIKSRKGEIFRQWIRSIESIGYQVDHQILNAADFGAATKRLRLFIVCRRGHSRRDIPWPDPTHSGRWIPAWQIIDWSKPCPSIISRKKPLAEKTLRRIEIGLRKFVGQAAEPFIVRPRNHCTADGLGDPLSTITTSGAHHGLAVPFILPRTGVYDSKEWLKRPWGPEEPLPTIIASHGAGHIVMPFIETLTHGGRERSASEPLPTITTAHRGEHAFVLPFLTKYYGTGSVQPVDEPIDTVTTKDRFGLAMVSLIRTMRELGVVDIGFRMLDVDELARAQGFPEGYYLYGTKTERVKQVGNAVCPPVARALCNTIAEAV
ncbi:MAG: DNA cytosine methyltransferase [Pirellulales bacterium]|nr:DNA cytosine methyltransferase [Pirellulales bacterium]